MYGTFFHMFLSIKTKIETQKLKKDYDFENVEYEHLKNLKCNSLFYCNEIHICTVSFMVCSHL